MQKRSYQHEKLNTITLSKLIRHYEDQMRSLARWLYRRRSVLDGVAVVVLQKAA
jgi:hypothetical protein